MSSDANVRRGDGWNGPSFGAEPVQAVRELSISNVLGMCRRHLLMLAVWVGVFTVLTGVIVYSLQPRYRAEATLIIDTRLQQVSNLKSVISTPFTTQETAPVMRSEVQILTSPELAAKVIEKLHLAAAPSFQDGPPSLTSRVTGELRGLCARLVGDACAAKPGVPDDASRTTNKLVSKYLNSLSVLNDGRSFTLSVSFQDPDPKLAAAIVNAHVALYLADQRAFKRQASVAGVAWIDEQLKKLGDTLAAKQKDLQALREASGLIYTKGATVVAQQVTDISGQLIQARADLAQRQARLPGAQGGNRTGGAAVQSEVLNSPLIQALRGQEAQARQALQDLLQVRGPDFPGVQQARARVDEVGRRIASETSRIVSANDGDVSVASKRVSELEHALASLQSQLISQDQASSRVAVMERDVEGTRVVYQGLLERQQELEVQAGTEEPDARLVAAATEPLAPFFPNKTIMLSLGVLLGTVSAVGAIFVIDKPERGIQLPSQLQALLGLHALTALPQVRDRRKRSLADYLLDQPKSEFAEAIHSLRGDIAALRHNGPVKVLAITSALPMEGKTSVATALARSMVVSGLHVLLVDCDLRRSSVGPAVNVRPGQQGVISVLKSESSLAQAVVKDSRTPLDLLLVEAPVPMPQDLLSSRSFAAMIAKARASYDFVVLDTPPQGAVSDALVIARQVDATLLAVRWNATPPTVVRWTLDAFDKRGLLPQGVFLNRVDYPSLTRKDPDMRTAYRSTRSYYLKS